jgi:hypothetical protein
MPPRPVQGPGGGQPGPSFAKVLDDLNHNRLTSAELQAWGRTGNATDAQVKELEQIVAHKVLTGDNHGNWLGQIERDLKKIDDATNPDNPHNVIAKAINTDLFHGLNLQNVITRLGEIVLGVVLVGVGVAKLTGTSNMVSRAVRMKI